MMKPIISILFILLLGAGLATAQGPLVGPLIADDTAAQDRIILYDLSNMSQRELSFGPRWHRVWGFSADGCRVLLTLSEGRALGRLYSARLDGSDLRELVQYNELPDSRWGVWDAHWSPDGSRVAFTLIRDMEVSGKLERQHHVAWVDASGGPPNLYSASGDEHEPQWSPDGQWLAYIAFEERVPGADIQSTAVPTPEGSAPIPLIREADLWIISADGQTKVRLTNFPTGSLRGPRWSPDGLLIGFTYSPSPSNDQFWMIANEAGAIPTQLSGEWSLVLDTTWLPDSSAMVSAVRDFQGTRENMLWRIPLVGLADTSAVPFLVNRDLTYADYPRFSPDGQWLALRSLYNLAVVDTATQAWTILDEGTAGNTPPVWSPAGFGGEVGCIGQG